MARRNSDLSNVDMSRRRGSRYQLHLATSKSQNSMVADSLTGTGPPDRDSPRGGMIRFSRTSGMAGSAPPACAIIWRIAGVV
jgi:hypothetical protein